MEVRSVTRDVRMAPRKARLVADLIRGKQVEEALLVLRFCQKKLPVFLLKHCNRL